MPDIFPRRNLSPDSEPWGREIEKSIVTLEGIAASAKSGVAGQNRTTAATLGDLSRQLDRLDALYRSIPKPMQSTGVATGFGLAAGWQPIASTGVLIPLGVTRAEIFAVGSGFLTNTSDGLVAGVMRLSADGNLSPEQPWATYSDVTGFHASITPGFSWSIPVVENTTLTVQLQVGAASAVVWGAYSLNYATVAAMITFTG